MTSERLIISDLSKPEFREATKGTPYLEFIPFAETKNLHAWWRLSGTALEQMLRVVGFRITSESLKTYKFRGTDFPMLTLVADHVSV